MSYGPVLRPDKVLINDRHPGRHWIKRPLTGLSGTLSKKKVMTAMVSYFHLINMAVSLTRL